MATATQQLGPVYKQASQQINGLIPGAENIYNTLVSALSQGAQMQSQGLQQSAQIRGVGSPELQNQLSAMLGGEVATQQATLGATQAQGLAGLNQAQGQLGANRVSAIQNLSDTLKQRSLDKQGYQLDLLNAQRQLEIDKVQRAASDARQAASSGGGGSDRLTTSQALEVLGGQFDPGKDGYVNPAQWNDLRKRFIQAGYSGSSFDKAFSNLVNPVHQKKSYNLPRYQGIKLYKDR